MPFYEYECSACKYYVEAMQKISDTPLKKCPSCGKETLQRLISAPVFRLKGAGWYETDFKSDKEDKRNLAEDKEPADKVASTDSDDKAKVRASKALKKVAGKKAGRKVGKKAKRKVNGKKTSGKQKQPVKKVASKARKPVVKAANKVNKKANKKASKKVARKTTRKPAKKTAKKTARKAAKKK